MPGLDCVVIGANDRSGLGLTAYRNAHRLGAVSPPALTAGAGVGVEEILAAAKLEEIVEAATRHSKSIFFSTRDLSLAKLLAAEGVQILRVVYSYYYSPMAEIKEDWEWSFKEVPAAMLSVRQ